MTRPPTRPSIKTSAGPISEPRGVNANQPPRAAVLPSESSRRTPRSSAKVEAPDRVLAVDASRVDDQPDPRSRDVRRTVVQVSADEPVGEGGDVVGIGLRTS